MATSAGQQPAVEHAQHGGHELAGGGHRSPGRAPAHPPSRWGRRRKALDTSPPAVTQASQSRITTARPASPSTGAGTLRIMPLHPCRSHRDGQTSQTLEPQQRRVLAPADEARPRTSHGKHALRPQRLLGDHQVVAKAPADWLTISAVTATTSASPAASRSPVHETRRSRRQHDLQVLCSRVRRSRRADLDGGAARSARHPALWLKISDGQKVAKAMTATSMR